MNLLSSARIGWKNLVSDWRRLLSRSCGVSIAIVIIFMQNGFRHALIDSNVLTIQRLDADIILKSKARYAISSAVRFPRDQLIQASATAGVSEAYPLYLDNVSSYLRNPGHGSRRIRVIAFDLGASVFAPLGHTAYLAALQQPATGLIDTKSKPIYGFPLSAGALGEPRTVELADQRIELVGTFQLGIDFASDGNLLMSADNFARYFPGRNGRGDPLETVDFGVIRCEPNADLQQVKQRLQSQLSDEMQVMTHREFVRTEQRYWDRSTPIGRIFSVGVVIGFVVGLIICYQILVTEVNDHLAEFATLKAMGYRPLFFASVVVAQSFYLCLVAFLPALIASAGLFGLINARTGLIAALTLDRALFVLVLTLVMCMLSGLIALRKLLKADPASLF